MGVGCGYSNISVVSKHIIVLLLHSSYYMFIILVVLRAVPSLRDMVAFLGQQHHYICRGEDYFKLLPCGDQT